MPETKDITILAVDDNDAFRYSLSRALQGGGYRVIEARNGTEHHRCGRTEQSHIRPERGHAESISHRHRAAGD